MHNLDVVRLEIEWQILQTINCLTVYNKDMCLELIDHQQDCCRYRSIIPIVDNWCDINLLGKTDDDVVVIDGQVAYQSSWTILSIWVNDILLEMPALRRIMCFLPIYSDNNLRYFEEHNMVPRKEIRGENQFYFNGTVRFDLEDFFVRYHTDLMDCIDSGLPDQKDTWVRKSHLGFVDPKKKQELFEILCQL